MDFLSVSGLILAVVAILVGQHLEGGDAVTLLNGPALLIVAGGTVGAVMLQSPVATFVRAVKITMWIFWPPRRAPEELIEKITNWSMIARKEGLLGLEALSETETDQFPRKGLQLLVDGAEPNTIRNIMEVEIDNIEHADVQAARVFESMGGYSPTMGIIGAVMGLIQVMNNLSDPGQIGHGIAVAFVATIYGIGLANLLLIPAANKLKSLVSSRSQLRYMVVEGIVSIAEGENPRNIQTKLQAYLH